MKKILVSITILRTIEVPDEFGDEDIRVEIEEGPLSEEMFFVSDANDIEWSEEKKN